jgi:hypothetical protein
MSITYGRWGVPLNSFDDVAKAYNSIKPIRGKRLSEDLRPLSSFRRYWWNRVIKINDNKYLLSDGCWSWIYKVNNTSVMEQTAPIVWERKADGDYMTVRSHMAGGIAVSRYQFLDRMLPEGMRFDWHTRSGKHFVLYKGESYYIPKFKGEFDHTANAFIMKEDNRLEFKWAPDGLTRVGALVPYKTRRIDKDVDRKYAPKVRELWDWMQVVLPVLGDNLKKNRMDYSEVLCGKTYWDWSNHVNSQEVLEILDDDEHVKRVALAVCLALEIQATDVEGRFWARHESFKLFKNKVRKVANMYAIEYR